MACRHRFSRNPRISHALLEVAANSVASALAAQAGGADRIELCTALAIGGLTPTHGCMAVARDKLDIPIHVLIRPRAGDFLYDDEDTDTMLSDIRAAKALGCEGVVIGALDADGHVDQSRCRAMIDEASGLDITFHRAIDVCREPTEALEAIIALSVQRILTSGGQPNALAGAASIRALIEQAAGRIEIMPGGGIAATNLVEIAVITGARQFHASAKTVLASGMRFARGVLPEMESGAWQTDAHKVSAMVEVLRA